MILVPNLQVPILKILIGCPLTLFVNLGVPAGRHQAARFVPLDRPCSLVSGTVNSNASAPAVCCILRRVRASRLGLVAGIKASPSRRAPKRRGYSYWGKVLSQVVDRRRYSPHGRFGALAAAKRENGLPQLYRGRAASSFKDLYETDHAESRQGGRFRWLISTCLAGTVGAISILVVHLRLGRQARGPRRLPARPHRARRSQPRRPRRALRAQQRRPQVGGAQERPAEHHQRRRHHSLHSSTSR